MISQSNERSFVILQFKLWNVWISQSNEWILNSSPICWFIVDNLCRQDSFPITTEKNVDEKEKKNVCYFVVFNMSKVWNHCMLIKVLCWTVETTLICFARNIDFLVLLMILFLDHILWRLNILYLVSSILENTINHPLPPPKTTTTTTKLKIKHDLNLWNWFADVLEFKRISKCHILLFCKASELGFRWNEV
jgi:hypothetical protein